VLKYSLTLKLILTMMEPIHQIEKLSQIKILADKRRLSILQLLMSKPATLSQLGDAIGAHPAKIRHHLKLLESAGFVKLIETRLVRGFAEKYYQANARAFLYHEMILPSTLDKDPIVVLGSHDLALEFFFEKLLPEKHSAPSFVFIPVGSLEGLIALRQGKAHIAGIHLVDVESGNYNLPYVEHLLPDREVVLVTLAHRVQGLILAPGNPHQIHSLADLSRTDLRMINRNQGSGTRLWLDKNLNRIHVSVNNIRGYRNEVFTHTATADAVLNEEADVGIGLQAAARSRNLEFIPLFKERYDLVMSRELYDLAHLQEFHNQFKSREFRTKMKDLGGYATTQTGYIFSP